MNQTEILRNETDVLEKCVLAMYDIRGKQNYIYRSTSIKEIVGGSAIIRDCFKDYLYPAAATIKDEAGEFSKGILHAEKGEPQEEFTVSGLRNHLTRDGFIGEVVYEGGGNYLLIFKTEKIFREVTFRFTKALMCGTAVLRKYGAEISGENELPGTWTLRALGTCIGHLDFKHYEKDRNRLYRKHQMNEASESTSASSGTLPVVQVAYDTSMPLVAHRPDVKGSVEKITAESYAKYIKYKAEVKTQGEKIGEKVLDNIVKKKGEDSLLSVIYVDGNGMGAKVQERTATLESYEECVNALRELSREIEKYYTVEPVKRIDKYLAEKYMRSAKKKQGSTGEKVDSGLKRRFIVNAGDEMTFICNAHDAYDIMRIYLEGMPEKYSACAGAAIFHSHAPFNEAYRIAEECCENCKKVMRNNQMGEACLIDFHYCQSGIGISLQKIREHEAGTCISKPWMISAQKDLVMDTDDTTLPGHESKRLIAEMRNFLKSIGRSNVKGLADCAKRGKTDLDLEISRIKAHIENTKRESVNFDFVEGLGPDLKASLIYDMAIMYDLWFAEE